METTQDISFNNFLKNFKNNVSKIGLKNSIQKDYILKILYFSKEHLTAEEISTKIKTNYNVSIGIATVYRAMKFFHDMKLVNQLDIGDGIVRYELNLSEHHDHLICTSCGKIIEFADNLIELNQIKIAEKNNFILKEHVMTIYGTCEKCQN
ncbi:transcriptional regulator, Fur family [Arcobacter venerupis]|uniref:Ferric uptake regulation protein n=1 Tax=Arcobacter venerupis TaxID=1054033 RepID=A0AAE7B936_9BACT|nr:transcriptional repressor [Arcobacter venerupis]QKF66165.1 transcriptional regulator, Fur family [Arcobacter venerupis]RWS51048.1 transcriptional repressor [Arcobacter venerupis]